MTMKVILRCDVESLGRAGEVKEVSQGFGRNFLVPKSFAVPATESALRWWEKGKEKRAKQAEVETAKAKELAAKIDGTGLSFSRPCGPEGKLFGSVGKTDIQKSLKTCGFAVEKQAIALESAIKKVGDHEVELRLLPDVTAKIKVTIVARE